jgi:endo-1,3(4)-beta-glucanase
VTTLPSGSATSTPLPSGKTSTTGKVKVNAKASLTPAAVTVAAASSVDVFVPIATATPATSLIPRRGDNPAPVKGITSTTKPLNTNKFYANFFLENQYNGAVSKPMGKQLI